MSGDIFLNINTIVLHGLGNIDRHALAEVVQQALMEQLSSNTAFTAADLSRVRTNITLPANVGAEQLGRALGQSLNNVITHTEGTTKSGHKTKLGGRHDA